MLFTVSTVGVVTAGLSALGDREKALLAGIVLLGTASFIRLGAAQYADVPVGFFFLGSIVLLCMRDRLPISGTMLAGTLAAFAAWTKNEGLLFVVLLLIAMKWTKQPVGAAAVGAFLVLTLLAGFKLRLAPPNYLCGDGGAALLRRVTDSSRYLSIAAGFVYDLTTFGGQRALNPLIPLVAALFLVDFRERCGTRSAAIALSGMCAGAFFVYLITPFDVMWQVAWSLDRVLMQLWPAALFVSFCAFDFPVGPWEAE
jgi:hypothetical protein